MAQLMEPDYIETSPLGALDDRSAVLGFYSDAKASPQNIALVVDAERAWDGGGAVVGSLILKQAGGERRIRATYMLRRSAGAWRIALVHYTAIRPQ